MPHVNIKHYPVQLSEAGQRELAQALTDAVQRAFDVEERVISIALEPVAPEEWHEQVYLPEIRGRSELLCKPPGY
jgi:4-oxalocrotonate tautomerase